MLQHCREEAATVRDKVQDTGSARKQQVGGCVRVYVCTCMHTRTHTLQMCACTLVGSGACEFVASMPVNMCLVCVLCVVCDSSREDDVSESYEIGECQQCREGK